MKSQSGCSIIIPMYNEERYISRCLESLLYQTHQNFELILIDDGSTDKTVEIAKGYADKFNVLKILQQNRKGPGEARNKGASIAQEDILIFIDADMVFDRLYIEQLILPITSANEVGTAHGREFVANKENPIARAFSLIRTQYLPKVTKSGIFRAIKKDIFLQAGGFDVSKGYSDDDLSKRIGQSLIVEKAIAYHNNPESLAEVYTHSQRVGASLWKTGEFKVYLYKYKFWIIIFCVGLLCLISTIGIVQSIIGGIILLLLLIVIKSLQRAYFERYLSHIIFVPIVMIVRGAGYMSGIILYLKKKSIY